MSFIKLSPVQCNEGKDVLECRHWRINSRVLKSLHGVKMWPVRTQNTKIFSVQESKQHTRTINKNTGATTKTNVSRFYFLNVLNQLAPNWHDREWRARNLSRSGQWIARLLLQWPGKILIIKASTVFLSDFHVRYRGPTNRNAIRCDKMVYIKRTSLLRRKWDYTVVWQSQEYREQPEFWRSCRITIEKISIRS